MKTAKKIGIGIACGVPLVCCLGGFLVTQATFGSAARNLDAQLTAARREGIPLTPEDLDGLISANPGVNAAPIYRQAIELTEADKKVKEECAAIELAVGRNVVKPEERKKAIANLHLIDPLVAKLFDASKRPNCVWGRDWRKGSMVLFPELAKIKLFCRILSFRAEVLNERGDWKGALEAIRAGQIVARHAGEDPIIIGMLVHIAGEGIVFSSFDRIVALHTKDPAFIAEAQKVLQGFGPLPSFRKSLTGEVVMGRVSIRQLKSVSDLNGDPSGEKAGPGSLEKMIFSSRMVQDAFDAKFVEVYRELFRDIPPGGEGWEKAQEVSKRVGEKIDHDNSVANTLNKILFPVFSQAAEAIGRVQMHRRLTGVALRLMADRNRTGKYPAVLPDYGDLGIDPFSGERFHYRLEGTGFRLYSVGTDRIDDDGKPIDRGRTSDSHDEVIVIR